MSDDVLLDKRDGVGVITLNRPDSLNAMGGRLLPMLGEFLAECEDDREVRCVALTGAGRGFCAGGDVKNMQSRNDGNSRGTAERGSAFFVSHLERQAEELRRWHDSTTLKMHTMAKPVVGLINGVAVGAGLSLALATDIRIASERARFGTAFRNVALSGDFGGTYLLPRLIGMGKARELFFTGEIINADKALEIGLVNQVIPHDDLMTTGFEFCRKLAQGPTATLGRIKANLNRGETGTLKETLDQEAFLQRFSGLAADSREAVRAFMERREPAFTGE
ncbi:MAG TPA: enoyl-CoA hydratase [Tepidiformaceae bacterium]|nr:enoyl-CoA hydratase [Tepidiformaceae bacterium]